MIRFVAGSAMLLLLALPLAAQQDHRLDLGPFGGALVPTGAQAGDFQSAATIGAQVLVEVSPMLRLVATGAWTDGRHKFPASNDQVDIWQYDAGVEVAACGDCATTWDLYPFFGLGVGGRTNDYHTSLYGTTSCLSGYGALGVELAGGALGARLEGRDYLSCLESPATGTRKTRNDLRLSLGALFRL